jgi:hypothetical protein
MLALWAAEPGKARFDSWLLGRLGGADCHH